MNTKRAFILLCLMAAWLGVAGCGGGGSRTVGQVGQVGQAGQGRGAIRVTIQWPKSSGSRSIPIETQSITFKVQILEPDKGEIVKTESVNRSGSQDTVTKDITEIPSVKVRIIAIAHDALDGTGNVLAMGSADVKVVQGATVPADIEIDKIDHLVVTPDVLTVQVGNTSGLAVKAVDAAGHEVGVDPTMWQSSVIPGSIATVGSNSASVIVTGVTTGTGSVTVELAGTNFSANASLTVAAQMVINGEVNLMSQTQVNQLTGVTEITGPLMFGPKESATDPITNVSALSSLSRVGGKLLILKAAFSQLKTLSLPGLQQIGGELQIEDTQSSQILGGSLTTVTLPALTTVTGRVVIQSNTNNADLVPDTVMLPQLTVKSGLAAFMAPGLKSLTLQGVNSDSFEDAAVTDCPDLENLNLGQITVAQDMTFARLPKLKTLTVSGGSVGRDLQIFDQVGLSQASIKTFEQSITIGRRAIPDLR